MAELFILLLSCYHENRPPALSYKEETWERLKLRAESGCLFLCRTAFQLLIYNWGSACCFSFLATIQSACFQYIHINKIPLQQNNHTALACFLQIGFTCIIFPSCCGGHLEKVKRSIFTFIQNRWWKLVIYWDQQGGGNCRARGVSAWESFRD